uniref:Uncharacterized protein n=1 Tax=Mantoniella antarctica TaxID=81844 RepID=A0A7S0SX76_9CHLO
MDPHDKVSDQLLMRLGRLVRSMGPFLHARCVWVVEDHSCEASLHPGVGEEAALEARGVDAKDAHASMLQDGAAVAGEGHRVSGHDLVFRLDGRRGDGMRAGGGQARGEREVAVAQDQHGGKRRHITTSAVVAYRGRRTRTFAAVRLLRETRTHKNLWAGVK